jgi:hypothetical protein
MITMREIDDARHALGIERETFRSLRDHHLGVVDAIFRMNAAEERVEKLLAQWWAQDCQEGRVDAMKILRDANAKQAEMLLKMAERETELESALRAAETKLREVPCVDSLHLAHAALPEQIAEFVTKTWGAANFTSDVERTVRVVEEAIEFAQANGLAEVFVKMLAGYVYNRLPGAPVNEAAGLGVTLIAWCHSRGIDLDDITLTELARVKSIHRDALRAKQHEKFLAGFGIDAEEP